MVASSTLRLRRFWFQLHKWLGLLLAALVVPISLTGAALVWHDWLELKLNPERGVSAPVIHGPGFYAAAAQRHLAPAERLLSLTFPDGTGAVQASAARPASPGGGRPVRTLLYLHPTDGRLLDRAASNEGVVHVMHVLHGSLMVPGLGRQIVGWVGVALLLSALSGLWLWWPFKGGLRRGLRWRRGPSTASHLHYQGGFWIALPLAALSATGVWISFPAFFAALSGDPAGPSPAERMRRMAAAPLVETRLTPDSAAAAARPYAAGALRQLTLPTDQAPEWKLTFARAGSPAEVTVSEAAGAVTPPKPVQPETTARLMRRLHDGTGFGPVWQTVIFLGGLIPALLAVTGILIWLRSRRQRARLLDRRSAALA